MKKKILITGSKGFIGSTFLKFLDKSKFEIVTLGRNNKEDLHFELNSALLANDVLKEKITKFSPEYVFHFASGSSVMLADKNKNNEYENAFLGTDSLIKVLSTLKVKPERIVYLSSQAVYGLPKYLPLDELHETLPVNVYGENKLKTEKVLLESGLEYVIFRVSSVYGPFQDPHKSGVIAKFINRMQKGQSPIVFNSLELIGDFIYVDDVASVLVGIIKNDFTYRNEIYNLGFGKPVALKNILEILYKYFPNAPQPILQVNKLYPSKKEKGIYLDITKLQSHLGWRAKYNIEEGLKLTAENALGKVSGVL